MVLARWGLQSTVTAKTLNTSLHDDADGIGKIRQALGLNEEASIYLTSAR